MVTVCSYCVKYYKELSVFYGVNCAKKAADDNR